MRFIHQLKLAHKLFLIVAFGLLVTVLVASVGILQLKKVSAIQRQMYAEEVVPLRMVGTASWQAATHFRRMYPYMLKTDLKSRQETQEFNGRSEADIAKAIDYEKANPGSDDQRALVDDLVKT